MVDDSSNREERWVTIGLDAHGRVIVFAYTWRSDRARLISARKGTPGERRLHEEKQMKRDHDFSKAKRGPVMSVPKGKTRITIRLDEDVIAWFRNQVDKAGGGNYQGLFNDALLEHVGRSREPLEATLRRVIREEIRHVN
jgi:uncharacterized protein (DUF4415 family)